MAPRTIDTVTVLGAGSMGHGIAEVAAIAGYDVRLRDIEEDLVRDGYDQIEWSLEKLAEGGHLGDQTVERVLERVVPVVEMDRAVEDTDLVIEAVPERMEIKEAVYGELEEHAPDDAIFASNTSSLSITDLASNTTRPAKFCGLHFFNPPVRMELVEVVSGAETDEETLDAAVEFVRSIEKTPILVSKDSPGFIVNRILVPLLNEAAWLVDDGTATIETVDSSAKFDLGLPMGAFELADQIGVDVILDVVEHLHATLGDPYEPSPLLVEQVDSGAFGKKTGEGFYEYEDGGAEIPPDSGDEAVERRLVAVMANEAAKLIENDVADAETIDEAVTLGGGFPTGPCRLADEYDLAELESTLESAREGAGHPRYEPTSYLRERAVEGGFLDDDDGFETIRVDHPAEDVGRISIDRPNRMNTITPTVLAELETAVDSLVEEGARSLLIDGEGDRAFSAGAEVQSVVDESDPVASIEVSKRGQRVFGKLESCDVPVVAAIDGFCLGGGMELATCADLRIASERSTFGQPEHDLGLLPGWGGTQRLSHLLGESRAKEIIFTADNYDAETMERYGFVNELVGSDELDDRAIERAESLAGGPSIAQRFTKRAMAAGRRDIDAGLEIEAQAFGHLMTTDDLTEGIAAFRNDRDPEFTGK
ncbi:3-hydroxyacyl-CoA dehydrogenase NAD-binding protein (plasmid) [Haloterrigena turkmenica DSM 5511]|uniref:enoyl-CoA hydratase n=1 Tax=Haloterrigena turkmenica (strain ATCC 51198 / DSM 5511 / JCM 9101 / NCIMB 13204 / VKM B-1734 / 4k) TaxID=543526 RepID=D2RZW2_HALTV|nr:3-hydroxyacyl-CoA dehydrogenase/enoyl-CoA hydratase family protein [Haloterrigena turkmenica]ADB62659.1 3-hydroxyacyl-CoA dehydrogenase NAD-binding protein [Haloterrigena turkmenica DSM 5511]